MQTYDASFSLLETYENVTNLTCIYAYLRC